MTARGLQPAQQPACLDGPRRQLGHAMGSAHRPAAEPGGAHPMDLDAGNPSGKGIGPRIGQEMHRPAARDELGRERLGREQVTAGAAGGEHEGPAGRGRAHNALPASRRRVSASSIPIAKPSESIEEPP